MPLEEDLEFTFIEDEDELLRIVAGKLCENKVIGWMQKSRMGLSALGNKILNSFRKKYKNSNEKIIREPYRPFAPAVTIEDFEKFFDVPKKRERVGIPELYMLSICQVKEMARIFTTITHVDGSARVQFVKKL